MPWSEPFLDLVQSRIASVREAYDAATSEITTILNQLDDIPELPSASTDELANRLRKLERAIRDIRWSAFEGLEVAQSARHRTRLRGLRERVQKCVARISEAARKSSGVDYSVAAQVTSELLELRQRLADEERRLLTKLSRWTFTLRLAVALVVCGAAAATAFFLLFSGMTIEHFQPLAPTADYELHGDVYRMTDTAKHAITARYSEYLTKPLQELSSLPSVVASEPDEKSKTDQSMRVASFRPVSSLFHVVWETELVNRSYLQSEYVRTLLYRVRLVNRKPFPWDDVFADPTARVSFHVVDQRVFTSQPVLGYVRNEGKAPVLMRVSVKANGIPVIEQHDHILGTSNPYVLFVDPANWAIPGSQFQPTFGQPIVPRIANAPVPALPVQVPDPSTPPPMRIEAGTVLEGQLTYETIDGKSIEEPLSIRLPMTLERRSLSFAGAPSPSGGAAPDMLATLTGRATTVGEHTMRANVAIDVEGIVEGEVRTAVVPVDRYLAARGHFAVYSQFTPNVCGVYQVSVSVDGRDFGSHMVDVISPEMNFTWFMTAEQFKTIQQRFKESKAQKETHTTTKGNAESPH